jgi:hypothetical protein
MPPFYRMRTLRRSLVLGASLGAVNIDVDGAGPLLGNDAGGLICGLVLHHTSLGMPGRTTPARCTPSPRVLRCHGPGVSRTTLAGFPWLSIPTYRLGQVEDNTEFASNSG